ncbi:MAG: thiol reductant ABC exporter subunit CydC, partial [Ilumatobacteraceae bacterium]
VYGALPARLEHLAELDAEMTHAEARSAAAAGLGAAVATLAAGAAVWAGLWFGVGAVDGRTLAGVSLAVVVLVPLAVHEVVAGLAPAAQHLPALAVAAARVREVFEQPVAVREPTQPVLAPRGPYGLRLRNVHAAWTPGSVDVLAGVDLDVCPGSRTLVVGPSGAGKSTLAAVLLRLVDPTSGTVQLVGARATVDITRMAADEVRRIIGWCAQDADIFDSTIEANLRLAKPDATRDELAAALRGARLGEWIDTLPLGIGTMVGEHGSRLSGGQRQRLALARVLLADRPIIVFDEPTEHLDEQTSVALAADLVAVTVNTTTIIVTHRPDLFPDVDTVVTMRGGLLSVEAAVGRSATESMRTFELADQ